jgi:sec-independent protein translocase protein TatC
MKSEMDDLEGRHQSLIDHLTELRIRITYALYGIIVGAIAAYNFSEKIFDYIRLPIKPYLKDGGLVFMGPMDKFLAHIKVSLLAGVLISSPFWFYQIWKFIAPGLYTKERKYATGFIGVGSGLFLTGGMFAYFLVLPMAFKFLMTFGGNTDQPMISIDEYMSFFLTTTLAFGVAFEMPLVISILGMLGIIDQKFLREKRRFAIMGIAIVAALITPPDLLSMLLMLVPMVALYEISILVVGFFERKNQSV